MDNRRRRKGNVTHKERNYKIKQEVTKSEDQVMSFLPANKWARVESTMMMLSVVVSH